MKNLARIILPALLLLLSVSVSTSFAAYGAQSKTSHCTANQALPDEACTPGAVLTTNPDIICVTGYTKTVRNVPLSRRKQVFAEYGIPYALRGQYEVDHLISLELGGSNDISNLWPEAYAITNGARIKDKLENSLHKQACAGKMTFKEAQAEISTNWLQFYLNPKATAPAVPAIIPSSGDCQIKGNISDAGKIYHLSTCGSYNQTKIDEVHGERWFCTEEEAVAAGWRKAKNCP